MDKELYKRSYGSRYNKDLTCKDIAKLVRDYIKSQVQVNLLPRGTYSVTSTHNTIRVTIKAFEGPILNPRRLEWERDNPNTYRPPVTADPYELSRYTKLASLTLANIESYINSYNHDGSEIMIDYFDVKFYSNIKFDYSLEREEQVKL